MSIVSGVDHCYGPLRLWIAPSDDGIYHDVLLLERKNDWDYYTNLHKDARFDCVSFKYPPVIVEEDKEETPEQAIYRNEHRYYAARKDMGQPLWRLHKTTIEKLMEKCEELSG
jgi:hypothetical protein